MSNLNTTLDSLRAQLEELRAGVDPIERDELLRKMAEERDNANIRAELAEREAQQAKEELEKTKAAISWTMQTLQIRDILQMNFCADEFPSAAEGWLPLNYTPEDTQRLEWINKHGRTSAVPTGFTIILPCNIDQAGEQTIPEIYNIRCMIDVARKLHKPEQPL